MGTFEQKLQEKVWLAREEQWQRCQVWLKIEKSNKVCNIYNKDSCPMRCDYALTEIDEIKPIKIIRADELYVNENIQRKRK